MNEALRGFFKAVLLVGTICIVMYFISYNKWAKQDLNSIDMTYRYENSEYDDNGKRSVTNISDKYSDIYNKMNYELLEYNFGEEFYGIYYSNQPLSNEFFIYLGVVNIIKNDIIVNCDYETEITSSELKNQIESILGYVKYTDQSFTTKNGNLIIEFNPSTNSYKVKTNGKCSGFDYSNGGIKNIYQKTKEVDDSLYIYEKSLYVESIKNSYGNITFNYYKGIDKSSELLTNKYEDINEDLLPTYEYEFKMVSDKLTLQSIKRV